MEKEKKEVAVKEDKVQVAPSQSELIRLAIEGKADLTALERVFELKMRDEANEAKKEYVKAMTAFKADPPKILKDKKVAYKEVKYSHASLGNVCSEINKALSAHNLSAAWTTKQTDKICVTCTITHIQGHGESTELCAGADTTGSKNSIQAIGSTVTYLQRYTLLSLTGLATHDGDDDGAGSAPVEYIDDQQKSTILDFIAEKNVDLDRFLTYMKIDKLEELPKSKFNQACIALKNAKGRK